MLDNKSKNSYWHYTHEPFLYFIVLLAIGSYVCWYLKADMNLFLVTAISAFSGAGWALFLSAYISAKKLKQINLASLTKAKYVIDKILKTHKEMKKCFVKHMDASDDSSFIWQIIPQYEPTYFLPEIEFSSLHYLLDHGGESTLDSIYLVVAENEAIKKILFQRNQNYSMYLDKTENLSESETSDLMDVM